MLTSAWLSSARHRPAAAPGPVLSALVACCAVLSAGCGEDMGPDRARPEPAYVIGIRPAPGATIFPDGKVVVVFNRDPGDVQCEGGRLDPDGQVGTVRTYRMEWGGTISFAWPDDGSLTVAYSPLGCVGEGGGGTLVAVTPEQGGPASAQELQANGIVMEFDETVEPDEAGSRGAFLISDSNGEEWRPTVTVAGHRITVRAARSGVFVPGRTYHVTGSVHDASGNSTEISLTYQTTDGDE